MPACRCCRGGRSSGKQRRICAGRLLPARDIRPVDQQLLWLPCYLPIPYMLTVSRPVIHEFAAKAREACGDEIEEIILFGSVARGDDRPDSDIDILVITSREDYRLREYLTGLAFDLLMLIRERLSVKVLSRADIVAHQKYPFIRNPSSRRRGGIGDRIGLL